VKILKTFVKNFLIHNMGDHSHHSSVQGSVKNIDERVHLRDELQNQKRDIVELKDMFA